MLSVATIMLPATAGSQNQHSQAYQLSMRSTEEASAVCPLWVTGGAAAVAIAACAGHVKVHPLPQAHCTVALAMPLNVPGCVKWVQNSLHASRGEQQMVHYACQRMTHKTDGMAVTLQRDMQRQPGITAWTGLG